MEHTKKFVLMDPRFVRPSMRDKVLSSLDSDISNILNSDATDEAKTKSYVSALSRFKTYLAPTKPDKPITSSTSPLVPPVPPATPAPTLSLKTKPLKVSRKRVKKVKPVSSAVLHQLLRAGSPLLTRIQTRAQAKKSFGSQWIDYSSPHKLKRLKAKASKTWTEY